MHDGLRRELAALDLHDKRLTRRVMQVLTKMSERPAGTIPTIFPLAREAKAAYRLLGTQLHSVDAEGNSQQIGLGEALLAACVDACVARIREQEQLVLAIQDTTEISFDSSPVGEAGGLWVHTTFACTAEGVPLGLLDQRCWQREADRPGREARRERPLEDKESYRWIEALRAVHERVPQESTVLTVADREADIYELFAEPRPHNSELLIRACRDRRTSDEYKYLLASVEAAPVAAEGTLTLQRRPDRGARVARLRLRYKPVTLLPPTHGLHEPLPPLNLWAILVEEPAAPEGEKPVCWLLLTTLPITETAQAYECLQHYTCRWLIERFHYVLKSGCRVEDSQLRTLERLRAFLGLCCVVAWRLLWITYSAREAGDQPATVVFLDIEWQAAYCALHQGQAPPKETPTLREAVRWVAQLGGFLAREGDGDPGVKVLWRGMKRLHDIVLGALLFAPHLLDVGNA